MTGRYPTLGLKTLLEAKIPVFDVLKGYHIFEQLHDENEVEINFDENIAFFYSIWKSQMEVAIQEWTFDKWKQIYRVATENIEQELNNFIDNTLEYASREKDFVLKPLKIPPLKTKFKGKHAVVVVRGKHYREDLAAIRSYIEDYHPILVGVDGGADALMEHGLIPQVILGDMDSVSDEALKSGAEIIVHAYPDGRAPGITRVKELGLEAKVIPSLGTSEDVAMLLAYEQQAEIIVALGAHSHMIDFLEKGRKGMASTVLVRMKIGTKLVDAKGVSQLYHPSTQWKSISLIGIAAITPILAISLINQDMVRLLEMMWLNIKMLFT
ncbi:putative cytokinetic ring protein SteA [Tepidibacillus decaturensis]|uniref:putative cytokinetic ring protein SteA n=3 Tax=Bacillaceae TaxID=186817 RepID=UPI000AD66BC4|nr:putative cytokinetic ring protein SteA [Tepidibacillus decaturensis]